MELAGRSSEEWCDGRTQTGSQQSCPHARFCFILLIMIPYIVMSFMVLKVLIYYSIKINKNWRSEMTCPKARRGKLRLTRVCNSLHTSPSMGYLLRHDVHLCEYAGTGLSLKWCFNEFLNPAIPVTATERTPKT